MKYPVIPVTPEIMRLRRPLHSLICCAQLAISSSALAQPAPAKPPAEPQGRQDSPTENIEADKNAAPSDAGEGSGKQETPAHSDDSLPADSDAEDEDDYDEMYQEQFADDGASREEISMPPPTGKGAIWGVLTDTKFNEPLFDATVSVIGTRYQAVSDVDGRFRLELAPGTYSLRFFAPLHQPTRLDGVVVSAGVTLQQDLTIEPDEDQGEVIDVVAEVEKSNIEGQTLARQRSASVGDSVGRQEISKSGDSTAAQAAQRVVGATIVGGRFVYVRGLGERYSNALFDGAPLPSPEPDRAAVPLDVFPAEVIDSITLNKTFTPDVPGDFAGGSVQVQTRAIPDKFVFSAGTSLGFNTESTFRHRLNYTGSTTDWLGFDSSRGLPGAIPSKYPRVAGEQPDGSILTREQLAAEGKLLNRSFGWRDNVITPPDYGFNVVIGNGWKLGGEQKFGAIAALTYKRGWETIDMKRREFRASVSDPRGYEPLFDYDITRSTDSVQWGAFGSLSYAPAKRHTLRLVMLRSQLSDDDVEVFGGSSEERSTYVTGTRLQFSSRALSAVRLSGAHEFSDLSDAELDWSALYSLAERDEPDTRDIAFSELSDGRLGFLTTADSGRHFFAEQDERGLVGTLDYTQPLLPNGRAKLKLGSLASLKDREFNARRFNFAARPGRTQLFTCAGPHLAPNCADSVITNDALDTGDLRMQEGTQRSDGYTASLDVVAGYVMADVEPLRDLRAILGERVEYTRQTIQPWDFGAGTDPGDAHLSSTDLLPSLSLVYSATEKLKVRAAVSRTLARPQLRELAPFAFNDSFGGRSTAGNPDLTLTRILNADLRVEYFPSLREVVAASLFYKRFTDPIELTLLDAGGSNPVRSFRNSPGANLVGLELEGRKNLEILDESLHNFSLVANLTLARSRVEVEQTGFSTITSLSRPMMNQAPWVVNAAIDYDNQESGTSARVLYNVTGPRIVEVGTSGIPDAYLHAQHMVDLVASQKVTEQVSVKLGVDNILNAEYLVTQGMGLDGNNAREQYTSGTVISVGAGYTH